MPVISQDDKELIHQLLEDAEILAGTAMVGLPRPALVRTTFAPVLRKWIVEGAFYNASKWIRPHEPTFEVTSTPEAVKLCKAGFYEHWMEMIRFGDVGVGTSRPIEKHRLTPQNTPHARAQHRASVFFKQKIFYWKGNFYTRENILQMHANRLGGVHFDTRRKANETHINELKNFFGFEVKPNTNQMLVGDEIRVAREDPSRRNAIYDTTELVTMDTGLKFANGVLDSRREFEDALRS